MTATSTRVTKTVITRSWKDIDPKIAVSAAVIAIADVVLVALYLVGAIDVETLTAGLGPSAVAIVAGYVKRSTHVDPADAIDEAAAVIDAVAPIVKEIAPAAAPVVDEVVDGVAALQAQLQPAPAPGTLLPPA